MKFFGWMQSKLNGKLGHNKHATVSANYHAKQDAREEFSDWPHGFLAIGTFGNSDLNPESQDIQEELFDIQEEPSSSEDLNDFSPEEVGELQKELTKLLSQKRTSNAGKELANMPLDRFLNCPSSLEVDRRISNALSSDSEDKDTDIEKNISILLGRCKDICAENKKKAVGKKSISFLLKKMFVCRSGFAPTPSLRHTLQESRLEKFLRVILHKKICAQNTSPPSTVTKYLKDKRTSVEENEDETHEKNSVGCKWVKTDAEYIVLEI